jgi:hypothetical protein
MRSLAVAAALLVLAAASLRADSAKECLDLSARIDHDVSSPSGVRVMITGRNHCSGEVDSHSLRFKVKVFGSGNSLVGTQHGRFGGMVEPGRSVETLVFVECDPDRARSVTVEAD